MPEFIDNHRDEINEGLRSALLTLDGSKNTSIGFLTGFTTEELDDLGGFPESCDIQPAPIIGLSDQGPANVRMM